MGKRDGHQQGSQDHAEGQHGDKARSAFIEGLHGKHGGSPESEGAPQEPLAESGEPREGDGRHRLAEDRQQHDEAEKNSEKLRTARELDRTREPREGDGLNGPLN